MANCIMHAFAICTEGRLHNKFNWELFNGGVFRTSFHVQAMASES